jgi:single-strand DNA-binding protein
MPSFNRVTLIGNLTRDPQLKQLPSSTTVAEFGLATSRRYRTAGGEDREEVCYVDCAAFGKQADVIGQYCKKGRPLFVEGRLKFDQWDDKQSMSKRTKLSVVVENFQFLGGRDDGSEGSGGKQEQLWKDPDAAPAAARSGNRKQKVAFRKEGDSPETTAVRDEDIPF